MNEKIEHPFESFPATQRVVGASGDLTFRITPKTLSPTRAKTADLLSAGISMISGAAALHHIQGQSAVPDWLWAIGLLGPWLAYPALKQAGRLLLKKRTRLVLTETHFKVKRWNGWKQFDRTLPHKFTLIPHDKTQVEQDKNQLAMARAQAAGEAIGQSRYYSKSFHLCFDYVGQRRYLLAIYGSKDALAVLSRLKSCDEVLNTQAHMGEGVSLSPDDQWTQQPGDILEGNACIK